MYAGLGDVWDDLAGQLVPGLASAAAVFARLRDGRAATISIAVAQASAAGEIDPTTARLVSEAAGQVQAVAGSVSGVSQLGQWAKGLPAWALPVGIGALAFLLLRR